MLKINNLNKYYNKNKKTKLHILKDITMSLPEKGLISIVGESGSGKTTLLHSIGGLDKYEGEILYNGNSYKGDKLDLYRQDNIGVIFQNYLLFEDLTVYENLVICLRVIGIKDKEEVNKRIEYVLKQVGMYKQRKKLAKNLSGGQQQRISIARALIKNTKILLADEPTGNLDRKNTIEIMNILKQISKTTLVILVTHNKEMANIYSDQILNMFDGQLLDKEIEENFNITNYTDDTIYLEDYNKKSIFDDSINLELYGNIKNVNIKIIYKDNRYYLVSDQDINIIKKDKVKEKRENITYNELSNTTYDTSFYNDIKSTRTLSTFKEIIIDFFRRKNKKQRFVNFSFFALGIILAICVTTFFSLVLIKTDNINYMKNKYIIYDTDNDYAFEFFTNYEDINQYIDEYAGYSYMYVQKYDHDISYNDSFNYYDVIFLPLSDLEDEELISGTKNKMVISTKLVKNMFETTNYNEVIGRKLKLNDYDIIEISGVVTDYTNVLYLDDSIYYDLLFKEDFYSIYKNYDYLNLYDYEYNEVEVIDDYYYEEQFIPIYVLANSDYKVNDILYCNNDENLKLKVIGRINVEGLSDIYDLNIKEVVNNLIFMKDLNKLIALNEMRIENEIFKDLDYVNYKIVEGKLTNNGVLAPINCDYKLGETVYLNNSTVQISGFYEARYAESKNAFLATKENIIFNLVDSKNGIIYFETTNLNAIYDYLNQNYKDEFAVSSVYDYYYNIEKENNEESILIFGIISLILLIIYVLFVYFVMRTRVLNDQYDIAVYRSLGATKKSFYAKYIKEVVVISLFTSTIGYIISFIFYILFNRLAYSVIGLNFFRIDLLSFMIGLLILYVINIIFGLIPIMMYLKKSPAELVSKYDM